MADTNDKFWFAPRRDKSPRIAPHSTAAGDRSAAHVYVFDDKDAIVRAVNVAGATGRPLLVDGPSGCGKSSLALYVAWYMDWPLHFFPVTSRTQSSDLMYKIDHLKRLQDAQAKTLKPMAEYVEPEALWKAFDPAGAAARRAPVSEVSLGDPFALPRRGPQNGAVVLIDEIDKADPDVPNNLLVPLGSYRFRVPELNIDVYAQQVPFIVLTTNNERKLPPAFLRRCVHLTLPAPDQKRLLAAGEAHYGTDNPKDAINTTIRQIAGLFAPSTTAGREGSVSIAEYLDAVRACQALHIDVTTDDWKWVQSIVVGRTGRSAEMT
jgi:MoxR-like ATPase